MKIAITGASSTGKTALAKELLKRNEFHKYASKFLSTDARGLLALMGYKSMDLMTKEETLKFQEKYFLKKTNIELNKNNFITDRSYVDGAAYWLIRDAYDLPNELQQPFINKSKIKACEYDLHIYLPFGVIEFESDGYRSENIDFHKQIDIQIKYYLNKWGINYITLSTPILEKRVEYVLNYLKYNYMGKR